MVKVVLSNGPLYALLIGGDFMHLLCVYSTACKVGFVGWTSSILLQDSVRQYFSACYSENAIPSKTGQSCALYVSKTCLLTTEGCHVVLWSFECTGKLVEFFNTYLYVRINLLIAAYEAGRLWTCGVVVLAGVETCISTRYFLRWRLRKLQEGYAMWNKKLTAKKFCVKLHTSKCDGYCYGFRLQSCCGCIFLLSCTSVIFACHAGKRSPRNTAVGQHVSNGPICIANRRMLFKRCYKPLQFNQHSSTCTVTRRDVR